MSSVLAKRPREEEEVLGGLGDRGSKKSRLGLFSVPSISMQLPRSTSPFTPSSRPSGSIEEHNHAIPEETVPDPFRQWREEKKLGSLSHGRRPPTLTLHTAMDVDAAQPSPFPNGDNLSPWPANPRTPTSSSLQPSPIPQSLLKQSLTISGGRTSTPIHSHFTVNMSPELMDDSSHPSSTLKPIDESSWRRRRRLPSPISETGGDSPAEPPQDFLRNSFSENTDNKKIDWPDSPSSMEIDDEGNTASNRFLQVPKQKIEKEPTQLPEIPGLDTIHPEAATPTRAPLVVPKREKICFSMGYRADCEKCQMRVPGHYSHIVRS